MKKYIYLILLVLTGSLARAQVKVGNNPGTINASAALEIESTNKGFLPPRVALQSRTDQTTIPSSATGLIVYNTGSTGLPDAGIYVWDGEKWSALKAEGGTSSVSNLKVGETRTGLITVTASTFYNGNGVTGVPKTWMNSATTSTPVNYLLLSDAKGTTTGFPVFAGLRMDFSSGGYSGPQFPAPKMVNTTANTITYSVAALSTNDPLVNGTKHTIVPGAVCWKVDGNDGFGILQNNQGEYDNAMITVHKGSGVYEFYMATWKMIWVDTEIIGVMTVTRYN